MMTSSHTRNAQNLSASDTTSERDLHKSDPCGPLTEAASLHERAPRLVALWPVSEHGHHELLRVAASLTAGLEDAYARIIQEAADTLCIRASSEVEPLDQKKDLGILARVGGHLYALGRREFLGQHGAIPHQAELRAAERVEAQGAVPYFVVALEARHCLGILGIIVDTATSE